MKRPIGRGPTTRSLGDNNDHHDYYLWILGWSSKYLQVPGPTTPTLCCVRQDGYSEGARQLPWRYERRELGKMFHNPNEKIHYPHERDEQIEAEMVWILSFIIWFVYHWVGYKKIITYFQNSVNPLVWLNDERLPPRKVWWQWNIHHLKIVSYWKMWIFQCHVTFQGCISDSPWGYVMFFTVFPRPASNVSRLSVGAG